MSTHVICVSGMHRCSTSLVAGVIRHLGVSLGDPARLMRAGGDNPVGYFELQAMMELNEELLAATGGAWDQPPVLDPGWEHDPALDPLRSRASQLLDDVFGPAMERAPLIGFKDPRLSLLLPFWRTVVDIDTTIVMTRDPREVAASLAARKYSVSRSQAAALWLRYCLAAIDNDPMCLVVRAGDVYRDLPATLSRIARHLGLPDPEPDVVARAHEDLRPDLRHHDVDAPRTASASATGGAPPSDPLTADPLMAVALDVWAGGALRFDLLGDALHAAFARGWLRPPEDGELLARARAEAVRLREALRRKNQMLAELGVDPTAPPHPPAF